MDASGHFYTLLSPAYTSFFAIFEFASSHDGRKFVNTYWIRFIAQIGFHHIESKVANLYAGGGKGYGREGKGQLGRCKNRRVWRLQPLASMT